MPDISPSIPVVGQPNSSEEPKVVTALTQLVAAVNNVDSDQLASGAVQAVNVQSALADILGVTVSGTVRRGKCVIATTEVRNNVAYGLMTTPDRVSSVVLPTDGLIFVGYQATWQGNSAGNSTAAIFVGTNQLKNAWGGAAAPPVQAATLPSAAANTDYALSSFHGGLWSDATVAYTGDVTTGQVLGQVASTGNTAFGGFVPIFAAAGTYDISVQFKNSAGVGTTVKNRRLWVWTAGF